MMSNGLSFVESLTTKFLTLVLTRTTSSNQTMKALLPKGRLAEGKGRGLEVQPFMRTQTMHLQHPKLMLNWPDIHLRVGRHGESYKRTLLKEGEFMHFDFDKDSALTWMRS
jgi:hypothetical protein